MPYPPSLPPASEGGAVLQPRQLQRWLDINPIHKLTRTQGYFSIPAFSVENEWKGYSDIVAVFNYTSTNNFSMKSFTAPTNPNYCATVMWVDDEYNVFRYRLWEGVGEVFYFDVPLYSNQLIKKNFRIEIWDTEPEDITQIVMFGADEAAVNRIYTKATDTVWVGPPNIFKGPSAWAVSSGTHNYRRNIVDGIIGVWYVQAGGGNPPTAISNNTICSDEIILINTSILGGYDYRFATDFAVATASAVVTDFAWPLVAGTFPLPFVWPADSVPTLN